MNSATGLAPDALPARVTTHRSGDYSHDPSFDPEELFDAVEREDSRALVEDAFRTHLSPSDPVPEGVTRAIAVFVRSSIQRGHHVEHVIRDLEAIQTRLEGMRIGRLTSDAPSELRRAVLRRILLAFYGGEAVAREDEKRVARRPRRDPNQGLSRAGDVAATRTTCPCSISLSVLSRRWVEALPPQNKSENGSSSSFVVFSKAGVLQDG